MKDKATLGVLVTIIMGLLAAWVATNQAGETSRQASDDRHHADFERLEAKVDRMNQVVTQLHLTDLLTEADDDRDDEQERRIKALEKKVDQWPE